MLNQKITIITAILLSLNTPILASTTEESKAPKNPCEKLSKSASASEAKACATYTLTADQDGLYSFASASKHTGDTSDCSKVSTNIFPSDKTQFKAVLTNATVTNCFIPNEQSPDTFACFANTTKKMCNRDGKDSYKIRIILGATSQKLVSIAPA